MEFWNKVSSTISSKGRDVAKKAKEQGEIFSLKSQIAQKQLEVEEIYQEVGKYVYDNMKEGAPQEVAEKFAAIDAAQEEIARMKQEVRIRKGVSLCPHCGSEINGTVVFCPFCGFKMPEDAPTVVDDGEVREMAGEAKEAAAEAAEEVKEAAAEAAEEVKDAVAEAAEEARDAAAEAVEEVKEEAQE